MGGTSALGWGSSEVCLLLDCSAALRRCGGQRRVARHRLEKGALDAQERAAELIGASLHVERVAVVQEPADDGEKVGGPLKGVVA